MFLNIITPKIIQFLFNECKTRKCHIYHNLKKKVIHAKIISEYIKLGPKQINDI